VQPATSTAVESARSASLEPSVARRIFAGKRLMPNLHSYRTLRLYCIKGFSGREEKREGAQKLWQREYEYLWTSPVLLRKLPPSMFQVTTLTLGGGRIELAGSADGLPGKRRQV
jgi:hypothetical protein